MHRDAHLLKILPCIAVALLLSPRGEAAAQVASAGDRPPPAIQLRFESTGYYGSPSGDPADCTSSRRNGKLLVEGNLQWALGTPPGNVFYTGKGRVSIDADDCGLKLVNGTNEFCNITVLSSYDADVTLNVSGVVEDEPLGVDIRWKPTAPVAAAVSGDCETQWVATVRSRVIAGTWQSFQVIAPGGDDEGEMLRAMARGGIPRPGRYSAPPGEYVLSSWTLSIDTGPVADVQIAIDGPNCSCIKGEEAEGKPVRFTATSSAKGGVFESFTVASPGKLPRVIANTGGAAPRLDLAGSRETGATKLAIVYTKDGKRYTAERELSFCVMDSVTMADGFDDIAFDESDPGKVNIRVASRAWLNGAEISRELEWTLEAMNSGTELTPGTGTGAAVSLGYTNLPRDNGAFGPKEVTVRAKSGQCNCTRERKPRVFFRALATNHPSAEGSEQEDAANFFYYWMKTAASKGINTPFYRYRNDLPSVNDTRGGSRVAARFVPAEDRIYIAQPTLTDGCRGPAAAGTRTTGPGNTGIDCFAENLRHEWQHRVDYRAWWPGGYPDVSTGSAWDLVSNLPAALAADADGDKVPASVEAKLAGCVDAFSVDPEVRARNIRSCNARPFSDVLDLEIYAYYEGWKWQRGSADREDWSCGGKQWKGGECRKE
ncbi:MAG: hypothetical protein H0W15_03310 [Gemmatimonadales bacterium]|nr:hypothetical protein [Gemmatimonadales bacterium]